MNLTVERSSVDDNKKLYSSNQFEDST